MNILKGKQPLPIRASLTASLFALFFAVLFAPAAARAQMAAMQKTDVTAVVLEPTSYNVGILDDEGRVWTYGATAAVNGRGNTNNTVPTQVVQTVDAGVNLPFITQIAGSFQNLYVMDRDGDIWSWGSTYSSALGRSGAANRPGKVTMPAGVKAKWLGAGFHGGRFVGTDGSLYVWGEGMQYILGNGSTATVTTPAKLTLDNDGNPLPTNFIRITGSDYVDEGCGMALTEDGKIYTWGVSGPAAGVGANGGSRRPRLIEHAAFSKNGVSNVKKIDVGNGSFFVLTNDGELYTWGDGNVTSNTGFLGLGNTADHRNPVKVTQVNNGVGAAAVNNSPVPVIRDMSVYAWSSMILDYDGNIYATGENRYAKHDAKPVNYNNLFTKRDISTVGKISTVAEGFFCSSYLDIYGNVKVQGSAPTTATITTAEPYVHYTGAAAAMFTALSGTPSSDQDRVYSASGVTLNATTASDANQVRYVVLYEDESALYTFTDGERYFDKTFFSLEQPYYNAGTNPKLLLSPASDLPSSRYYANPKISGEVFDKAYADLPEDRKGTMSGGPRNWTRANAASAACIVWVESKTASGITTRMVVRFDNIYTKTKVWHRGVKKDDASYILYQPEVVPGDYGMFLDRNGNLFSGAVPPRGYDTVTATPKEVPFWTLDPPLEQQISAIVLDTIDKKGDDLTRQPQVTFTYSKNPVVWQDVTVYYVDAAGNPVQVAGEGGAAVTSEVLTAFAPIADPPVPYYAGEAPYTPRVPVDAALYSLAGYRLDTPPSGAAGFTACSFPAGFTPSFTEANTVLYIVYEEGLVPVTETYYSVASGGASGADIPNDMGQLRNVRNLITASAYSGIGPHINGYALVGHEITPGGAGAAWYAWDGAKYVPGTAAIPSVTAPATVRFLYKEDRNNNGIPDDEEGVIRIQWVGITENNAAMTIQEMFFYGNAVQNDTETIAEDKNAVFLNTPYDPDEWIFHPGDPSDAAPYLPLGEISPVTASYTLAAREFYFYYDADRNSNGAVDKYEGIVTEKFRLYGSAAQSDPDGYALLTPPAPDETAKYMEGDVYARMSPWIRGYVCYAYDLNGVRVRNAAREELSDGIPPGFIVRRDGDTVTYLYKEDGNNNGIPDDEEAFAVVRWVAVTAAGSRVAMHTETLYGFDGDAFSVFRNVYAAEEGWLYYDTEVNGVSRGEADDYSGVYDRTAPASVAFLYDEDSNKNDVADKTEPIIVVVEAVRVDAAGTPVAGVPPLYRYPRNVGYADAPFTIDALTIPTFRIAFAPLIDRAGHAVVSNASVTIHPEHVNVLTENIDDRTVTVTFRYVSNMDAVTVMTYYEGTQTRVEGSADAVIPVEIGTVYQHAAPSVAGYTVTGSDPSPARITVTEGGQNTIIFYYARNEGNLSVRAVDAETGAIIGIKSVGIAKDGVFAATDGNAPTDADFPALAYYALAAGSGTPASQSYNGVTPPLDVSYQYTRLRRTVTLVARDAANADYPNPASYLGAYTLPNSYGVGAAHLFQSPSAAEIPALFAYAPLGGVTFRTVLVENGAGDFIVYFDFEPRGSDTIQVIPFLDLDGSGTRDGAEPPILSYAVGGTAGDAAVIHAPDLAGLGYSFAAGTANAPQLVTAVIGTVQAVYFPYVK
ncbi:MAG: hypothetical protein LBH54_01320, partial [Clostridiales bacterium]|nr:hypothetical protein [Clostridiales bacterium]